MIEKIRAFFVQFTAQFVQFFNSLTKAKKIVFLSSVALVLTFAISVSFWKSEERQVLVYSNLSPEDQTKILKFLQGKQVEGVKIEESALYAPEKKSMDVRMLLAQEGLPSSGMGVGWEKFDDKEFGATDFDQRINKLRAIQGELSRTINKLDSIESSRVHIVMPETAVFQEEKKEPTASIYLRFKYGKSLSPRQIQGILHLVAKAVEGLKPDNIAIVDQDGNILTNPDQDENGLDHVTSVQREYQKRTEKELESKIREILTRVVGHDKVVAKVQAEVDFKKVETTIQDVDPERSAVISSSRNEHSSNGSGGNPTGVPGAKSNLPGEKEDVVSGSSSQQSKQNSEQMNFEVKKTTSKIIEPVGTIKKLSAAVLVDGKYIAGKFTSRTAEETKIIENLVKNAVGFVEGRDSITVQQAQFELDALSLAKANQEQEKKTNLIQTSIFALVALCGMIFAYFGILKPYFKWLMFDPDKKAKEEQVQVDYELERSSSTAKRVQVQEEVPFEKLTPKEQIFYLARHDPKKTTEAIRQLLSPHQG
jgi:flagellar M-ring protein FliF